LVQKYGSDKSKEDKTHKKRAARRSPEETTCTHTAGLILYFILESCSIKLSPLYPFLFTLIFLLQNRTKVIGASNQ
jgi:hypothetical protein